jgi:hypothetical protein
MIKKTLTLNPADAQLPTNRNFGYFFSAVFAASAIYSYLNAWVELAVGALTVSILFAAFGAAVPGVLSPLNRFWYQLGLLISMIVSPMVLGIIFFVLLTPVSLIMRLFGRDELKIKKRAVSSYWVYRSPSSTSPESFKKQF